ncbi:2Fe-2S iron-sulfur cluster-binding protein [Alkalihalobacillus sp. MEB130]|uniref:2Fe-2S iron-sulfur cluster-binding protein n=1 Tax=Alkalihalobacillus sp. MEB130 TaxID=2976704 RepID=UPI0028E04223|nr:2Fe-2S iron-sulfur cluster-binding protein [Alkalihalobacillus sp. MEB130]MDT8860881.1 2Fe-2S iron-sulfur cluster-binding protein [Alkalihalobacillus sp. MEB130]
MSQKLNPIGTNQETEHKLSFELNGKPISLPVDPSRRLVDILRNDLGLTGTKVSCEIGRCGACMVLVDGKQQNSCLTMAYQCEGKKVVTIEGISENKIDPIQQAFLEEGGFQCGYCTPGMVVSVKALLMERPHATFEELKEGVAGNLCRCTGYGGIYRVLRKLTSCEDK